MTVRLFHAFIILHTDGTQALASEGGRQSRTSAFPLFDYKDGEGGRLHLSTLDALQLSSLRVEDDTEPGDLVHVPFQDHYSITRFKTNTRQEARKVSGRAAQGGAGADGGSSSSARPLKHPFLNRDQQLSAINKRVSRVMHDGECKGSVVRINEAGLVVGSYRVHMQDDKYVKMNAFGGCQLEFIVGFPYKGIVFMRGPKCDPDDCVQLAGGQYARGAPIWLAYHPDGQEEPKVVEGNLMITAPAYELALGEYCTAIAKFAGGAVLSNSRVLAGMHVGPVRRTELDPSFRYEIKAGEIGRMVREPQPMVEKSIDDSVHKSNQKKRKASDLQADYGAGQPHKSPRTFVQSRPGSLDNLGPKAPCPALQAGKSALHTWKPVANPMGEAQLKHVLSLVKNKDHLGLFVPTPRIVALAERAGIMPPSCLHRPMAKLMNRCRKV